MIEAVNSVVSNAPALRGSAEQASVARSLAANPLRVQEVALSAPETPKAPYISPYISLDYNYDRAVLQIRDSDTGEVQDQFPTESRLAEQQRARLAADRAAQDAGRAQARKAVEKNGVAEKAPAPQPEVKAGDIVSVQEVVAKAPSNTPQAATAAFSAGAQTGQKAVSGGNGGGVSVLA